MPGAAPATRQVMSGVDIQDPAAAKALTAKQGFADAGPALQIAVPGPADAVVEIKLYGRDGQKALPGGGVVTAKGGSVTEVSLAGVPAGHYTVAASSDVSFAAAARVTRGLKSDRRHGLRVVAVVSQARQPACGARAARRRAVPGLRRPR